jgi:hypothetical protein
MCMIFLRRNFFFDTRYRNFRNCWLYFNTPIITKAKGYESSFAILSLVQRNFQLQVSLIFIFKHQSTTVSEQTRSRRISYKSNNNAVVEFEFERISDFSRKPIIPTFLFIYLFLFTVESLKQTKQKQKQKQNSLPRRSYPSLLHFIEPPTSFFFNFFCEKRNTHKTYSSLQSHY